MISNSTTLTLNVFSRSIQNYSFNLHRRSSFMQPLLGKLLTRVENHKLNSSLAIQIITPLYSLSIHSGMDNFCSKFRKGILNNLQYIYIWAFSRHFYPKRLTISTFVIRSATIYRCRYSKDVHRTKCKYNNR